MTIIPAPTETLADTRYVPDTGETMRHQVLAALAQHRMATTHQLRELLAVPNSLTRQRFSQLMVSLKGDELVSSITLPGAGGTRAWFLDTEGVRISRDWPELRGRPAYPVTTATAASLRTAHTLTVVRAHLAFARDARARDDEHGFLDWTPEVAHQLPDGERLIADALLRYTVTTGEVRAKLRAFVEVDRGTMSAERLASKLIEYARFRTYEPMPPGGRRTTEAAQAVTGPAWQRWYPRYPRVLFVLTGVGRRAAANRIADLRAMTAEHPQVAAMARQVPLGAAVLEDIEEQGPSAPVWTRLGERPGPCGWAEL
ncbi:replication-relaxation family protein [Streptomyces sp. NPDC004111]|uniref:replication-relaxation family protein n=1 Tax=Streptomyces sp. NPDC004111 TaxID=3364690 RepID=UPI003697CA0F